jgi:hypothetical protein
VQDRCTDEKKDRPPAGTERQNRGITKLPSDLPLFNLYQTLVQVEFPRLIFSNQWQIVGQPFYTLFCAIPLLCRLRLCSAPPSRHVAPGDRDPAMRRRLRPPAHD